MINYKNHNQGVLFDFWEHLGPKRKKLLLQSWAGAFRENVLPSIPIDIIAPLFSENMGRPTKELYALTGAAVLQQIHDLTDEQTLEQFAFNEKWHYALNITSDSDDDKYFCLKTLYTIRRIMVENHLAQPIFDQTGSALAQAFGVDFAKQRLDSKHIASNMRHLGRLRLITTTIRNFLKNLKRQHPDLFDQLPAELVETYLKEKDEDACFSQVKPSDSERKLSAAALDLFSLANRFSERPELDKMATWRDLNRVLREQCTVVERPDEPAEVLVKPSKEVSADSLQNPSDPDAGYDAHKGQGYQVQVMETYTDEQDPVKKAQTLNLIDYIEVESASAHDAHALVPALAEAKEQGRLPEQLLGDSHYGGDQNIAAAKALGVELVAPVMGQTPKTALGLADFELSPPNDVVSCPAGEKPVQQRVSEKCDRHTAVFDLRVCAICPRRSECPVEDGKRDRAYLRYTDKEVRSAQRRKYEATPEFRSRYRWRAGVESTMSQYDRRTGVGRLRVRGLAAVRFAATLKAVGVNIFRAVAVKIARRRPQKGFGSGFFRVLGSVLFFQRASRAFFFRGGFFYSIVHRVDNF